MSLFNCDILNRIATLREQAELELRRATDACIEYEEAHPEPGDKPELAALYTRREQAEGAYDVLDKAYSEMKQSLRPNQIQEQAMETQDNQPTNQTTTQAQEANMNTANILEAITADSLQAKVESVTALQLRARSLQREVAKAIVLHDAAKDKLQELEEQRDNIDYDALDEAGEDNLEEMFLDYVDNNFEDFRIGGMSFDSSDFAEYFHGGSRNRQLKWVRAYVENEMDVKDTELYKKLDRAVDEAAEDEDEAADEVNAAREIANEAKLEAEQALAALVAVTSTCQDKAVFKAVREAYEKAKTEKEVADNILAAIDPEAEGEADRQPDMITLQEKQEAYQVWSQVYEALPKTKVYAFLMPNGSLRAFADKAEAEKVLQREYAIYTMHVLPEVMEVVVE